jgi:hypothetical protein
MCTAQALLKLEAKAYTIAKPGTSQRRGVSPSYASRTLPRGSSSRESRTSPKDGQQNFQQAFEQERSLHWQAEKQQKHLSILFNATEKRVDNLTFASGSARKGERDLALNLEVTKEALDQKNTDALLLEKRLQDAQKIVQALQVSLQRSQTDLAREGLVEKGLRERQVNAVTHCREMLNDMDKAMSGERVLRFDAEKNASELASSFMSMRLRYYNVSAELRRMEELHKSQKMQLAEKMAEDARLHSQLGKMKDTVLAKDKTLSKKIKEVDALKNQAAANITALQDRARQDLTKLKTEFNKRNDTQVAAWNAQKMQATQVVNILRSQVRQLNMTDTTLRTSSIRFKQQLEQEKVYAKKLEDGWKKEHMAFLAADAGSKKYYAQEVQAAQQVQKLMTENTQNQQEVGMLKAIIAKRTQENAADKIALNAAANQFNSQAIALVNVQHRFNATQLRLQQAVHGQHRSTARILQLWRALKVERAKLHQVQIEKAEAQQVKRRKEEDPDFMGPERQTPFLPSV